jgi:hypothetical protein
MLLVSLLGVIVTGFFISTSRSVATGNALNADTGTAANLLNEMTRAVRSGTNAQIAGLPVTAVNTAKPETLVLYSFVDTDELAMRPVKIQFTVDPTTRQVVETRWLAKDAGAGTWKFDLPLTIASTRTYPGVVVARSSTFPVDLFTYLDTNNNPLDTSSGSADPTLVAAVKIKLLVRPTKTSTATPVTISNEVGLPNLGYARTGTPLP